MINKSESLRMNSKVTLNGMFQNYTGTCFDVINPATEEKIISLKSHAPEQIDEVIAQAQLALTIWKHTDDEIIKIIFTKIANDIRSEKNDIAQLITLEQGKPYFLAEAEVEIGASWIEHLREVEIPVETYKEANGKVIKVFNKPIGIVASITPWNWPFMIAIWHLFPALKTKNCIINKPSEYTPLSTIKLIEIMNRHLPLGVCGLVLGLGDSGAYLTQHPAIGKVAFTGSTRTGKAILSNSVDSLKSTVLELGGNDAAIVLEDADLDHVAELIFNSSFINMGQTCTSIKRLYIHETIYNKLIEKMVTLANALVIGSGLDPQTTFGPVQNAVHYEKVKGIIADAIQRGACVLTQAVQLPEKGYFIAPTIIGNLPSDTRLIHEEQFGPVLPVIPFQDIDEVIQLVNNSEYGLGGSVWSKDLEKATSIAHRLETGTVWINRHAEMSPQAAFCGWKMSGLGHAFGLSGLLQFTQKQAIHINT